MKIIFLIVFTWIAGVLGLLFITFAYHRSSLYTNKIAPYIYSQLIWVTIFGFIFYNEFFDVFTFFGSLLIVVCGIYILKENKNY